MVPANVTPFYAGLLALLYFILILKVSQTRRTLKIGIGHGESLHLQKRIRAHSNFNENVPFTLLLFYFTETLNILPSFMLNVLGSLFVFARIIHALGLSRTAGTSLGRFWGTGLNIIINLIFAFSIIYAYILRYA